MHTVRALAMSFLVILTMTGCGASETPEESQSPPIEETAFGETVGTLDKARAVEGTVMQQKEDIDQALQESEGH